MNNELELYKIQNFEEIKHFDEKENEFWFARELAKTLEYTDWRNFVKVINKAIQSCIQSGNDSYHHFVEGNKMVKLGSGSERKISDYKLSRYACYLIVQNADPSKEVVALGQTYFAIQTRKQELLEQEIKQLTEDEKRVKIRGQVKDGNRLLNDTVYEIGARTSKEFAKFHNAGYKGLYGGETVKQIKQRKNLNEKDDILDYMGSTELAANWFRITQADEMIKQNNVNTLDEANKTHNKAGKEVRKTMIRLSGVKPEELPTPKKSIKQIEREESNKLENK